MRTKQFIADIAIIVATVVAIAAPTLAQEGPICPVTQLEAEAEGVASVLQSKLDDPACDTVQLEAGTFDLGSTNGLKLNRPVTLVGTKDGSTLLSTLKYNGNGPIISNNPDQSYESGVAVRDLNIVLNDGGGSANGISIRSTF